jgi:hypothetical protein
MGKNKGNSGHCVGAGGTVHVSTTEVKRTRVRGKGKMTRKERLNDYLGVSKGELIQMLMRTQELLDSALEELRTPNVKL